MAPADNFAPDLPGEDVPSAAAAAGPVTATLPPPEKVAEPAAETNHEMIIPSLPDDAPVQRPATARERLAQARRQLVFDPAPPDANDPDDGAFDDGPPRPPRLIGPAFAPGPRPGPPPRRHKWIEGIVLVLVLLAAVGSGLVYVDPHLQGLVQGWETAGMNALGIHADSKPSDLKVKAPDNTPVQPWQPPAPIFGPGSVTSLPHAPLPPTPVLASTPHQASNVPPTNARAPTPSDSAPKSPAAPVADTSHPPAEAPAPPVTPAPAPTPAPASVAESPADTPAPPDSADDDPFAKARTLRRRGIDAENAGDYANAVTLFEQIKDLPREAWPGDLELRLRAAKANAEGKPLH
jgi:hypothetical protein